MITKDFEPSVSLTHKACREIFHLQPMSKLFYGFFLGMAALLLVMSLASRQGLSGASGIAGIPNWVVVLFLLLYVFGLFPLIQYRAIAKNWKTNPSARAHQNIEMSEAGIRNFGEGFSLDMAWDQITRIRVSRNFVLFFISRSVAYFVPKHLFSSSELAQVQEWKSRDFNFEVQ